MPLSRVSSIMLCAAVAVGMPASGATAAATHQVAPACAAGHGKIAEEGFVAIGGIEQWITIAGEHCDAPVVLVLHGGPGNPMSPYAAAIYGPWQKDFVVVQWDQRGAGRTFGRNPTAAEAPLSVEQMTRDGIEVAAHLTRRLNTTKLVLLGSSWGSVLGVHMAKARPDLFRGYVGAAQLVDAAENQGASVVKLTALALSEGDADTLAALEALGPPPWRNPKNFGVLRKLLRRHEARTTDAAPAAWWKPDAAYATRQAMADDEAGEDHSYLQFVGLQGDGMFASIDLRRLGLRFEIPVVLIQGSEDLVTVPEVARRYFDAISAPSKDFVLLPRTGHDPNPAMLEAQHEAVQKVIGAARR